MELLKSGDYISYVTNDIRKHTCVAVIKSVQTLKNNELICYVCSYGYDIDDNALLYYGSNVYIDEQLIKLASNYQRVCAQTVFEANNILHKFNNELVEQMKKEEGKIYFAKTRDVKSPSRGDSCASGIDMYIPVFNEQFMIDFRSKNPDVSNIKPGNYDYYIIQCTDHLGISNMCTPSKILIAPGARICIPSGIKWLGKDGLSMNMHNKSGIGTKKGLVYLAEVVDKNYQGETHISIMNPSNHIVEICSGEKIIQIMQEPVVLDEPFEVSLEELYAGEESERGENWQGSTNNKQ